jgi:hypothetical protein
MLIWPVSRCCSFSRPQVQYAATATCEANFDCAKVEPAGSLVNNPLAVEVSLAGINIVNETGVAEICCSAAPAPGTVATWLEDVEACSDRESHLLTQLSAGSGLLPVLQLLAA